MFRVGRRCPVVPIWELEPIPRPAFVLAGRFPPLEPSPKRLLRLTRSTTRQKTLHADVFIQTWPVDPLATGNETPVGPLRRCPVRQTWEPRKWHRDRPAIRKFRDQSIVAHTYALGQCFLEFSPRSTHAMTSTKNRVFRDQSFDTCNFRPAEAAAALQADWFQPELRLSVFPLDMHVGRFVSIRRVKEQPVWPRAKNGWQRIPVYTASTQIGAGRLTSPLTASARWVHQ